jgi:hypothetical protein
VRSTSPILNLVPSIILTHAAPAATTRARINRSEADLLEQKYGFWGYWMILCALTRAFQWALV